MNKLTMLLIIIIIYIIGMLVTYSITKKRAEWAKLHKVSDWDAEDGGVGIFSILSWVGLIFFLSGRIVYIFINWWDKNILNIRNEQ